MQFDTISPYKIETVISGSIKEKSKICNPNVDLKLNPAEELE